MLWSQSPIGSLFIDNTPHADQWLWEQAQGGRQPARSSQHGSKIAGYGGLTILEPGTTHHAANTTDPYTGEVVKLGGLSFQEYFNYNNPTFDPEHKDLFYSSFGEINCVCPPFIP